MTAEELYRNNLKLRNCTPETIAEFALKNARQPVLTTNFRPYESAILHLVNRLKPGIPVVWCDTGYNTTQTYRHARELIQQLDLNIFLYVPAQTVAYREVFLGRPVIDTPEHDLFTEQVKLEPFRRAMREHQPDLWFTNLRKGQTAFRDSLDIMNVDSSGVVKVCPFLNWTDEEMNEYLLSNGLTTEFHYFDPTKVLSNRECGLHLH